MKEKATPSVLQLLRRWSVAGLVAALALAWTISTLVTPSSAYAGEDSIPGQNASSNSGRAVAGFNGSLTPMKSKTLADKLKPIIGRYYAIVYDHLGRPKTSISSFADIALKDGHNRNYEAVCIDPGGGDPRKGAPYRVDSLTNYRHSSQLTEQHAQLAYKFAHRWGKLITSGQFERIQQETGVRRLKLEAQNKAAVVIGFQIASWYLTNGVDPARSRVFWAGLAGAGVGAENIEPVAIDIAQKMIELARRHQIQYPGVIAGAAGAGSNATIGAAGFDANGNYVVSYELKGNAQTNGKTATLHISGMPQGATLIDNATAKYLHNGSQVTLPASVTLTLPRASASQYPHVKISATVANSGTQVSGYVRYPIDVTGSSTRARITVQGMPRGGYLTDAAGRQVENGSVINVPNRIYANLPAGGRGAIRVDLQNVDGNADTKAVVAVMEQSREVDAAGNMYVKVGVSGFGADNQARLKVSGLGNGVTLSKLNKGAGLTEDAVGEAVQNGSKVDLPSTLLLKVPAGTSAGQVSIGAHTELKGGGSLVGQVLKPSNDGAQPHSQWLLVLNGQTPASSSSQADASILVSWAPRPHPSDETPSIGTTLTATQNGRENLKQISLTAADADKTFNLVDRVSLTNLKKNGSYQLQGWLTDSRGQRANGSPYFTYQVTPSDIQRGYALVPFDVSGSFLLQNRNVTAFEELYEGSNPRPVAEHKVPNDPGQTVTVDEKPVPKNPQIQTQAWVTDWAGSTQTGQKTAEPGKPLHVNDVVTYTDLKVGQPYTTFAQLLEVTSSGSTRVVANGHQAFQPNYKDGSVNVALTLNNPKPNTRYVVFESLYEGTHSQQPGSVNPVATHRQPNDPAQTVTVTEERPQPAQFKIVKVISGSGYPQGDKVFDFDIRCGAVNKQATVVVRNGQTSGQAVVTGLETGQTCQVTENAQRNTNSYTMTPVFTSSSAGVQVAADKQSAFITLDKSNAQTVELNVNNHYQPNMGRFQVKKVVNINGSVSQIPTAFNFKYNCGAGWRDLGTLSNGQTSVPVEAKVGTICQVREEPVVSSTANSQVSWQGGDYSSGNTAYLTVGKTGTVLLTAINTITPKTGNLKLVKRVSNLTSQAQLPASFKLNYVCEANGKKVKEGAVNLADGQETVISDLPVGARCAVAENLQDAQVSGAKLAVTYNGQPARNQYIAGAILDNSSGQVTVTEGGTVEIVTQNVYTDDKSGGFAVTKQLSGISNEKAADASFKFNYTCTLPGKSRVKAGSFNLRAGETFSSTQEPELAKLPVGTNCEVWESQPAAIDGYKFQKVSWFKNTLGDNTEVTLPSSGQERLRFTLQDRYVVVQFTATNTYQVQLGGLKLTKLVTGHAPSKLAKYNFRLTCGSTVKELSLSEGGSWSYWGIPVGTRCTIEETGGQQADGSPIQLSDSHASHALQWQGTEDDASTALRNTVVIAKPISKQQFQAGETSVAVVAKNNYSDIPQFGKFSVTKQSVSVPGDDNQVITVPNSYDFRYQCTNGVSGTISGVTVGQSKESPKLPTGTQCTISEVGQLPQGANAQNVTWSVDGRGAGAGPVNATTAQIVIGENSTVAVAAENQYTVPGKPAIGTRLLPQSGSTLQVDQNSQGTYVLTDHVSYQNLIVGQTYKFSGKLMAIDAQGNAQETDIQPQESTMVATSSSGTQQIRFVVHADQLRKYSKLVAFEKLHLLVKGKYQPVAEHENPNDPNQSVPVQPWIKTVLTGENQAKQISTAGLSDSDKVTLTDTVEYHNLQAGKQYHLVGRLSNGISVIPGILVSGETFTPEGKAGQLVSGSTTMVFEVPVSVIRANQKLVAFEYLYEGPKPTNPENPEQPGTPPTAEHEDPNDPNQSVEEAPRLGTSAASESGNKEFLSGQAGKVIDTVAWGKLPAGKYVLFGTLMDKATSRPVPGASAEPVTFTVVTGQVNGTQQVVFNIPAEQMAANKQFVVFEDVYPASDVENGKPKSGVSPKVSHRDINDPAQTVTVRKAPEAPSLKLRKVVVDNGQQIPADRQFKFQLSCAVAGEQVNHEVAVRPNMTVELPYVQNGLCELREDTSSAMVDDYTPSVQFSTDSPLVSVTNIHGGIRFNMPPKAEVQKEVLFTATNTYPAPQVPSIGTTLTYQKGKAASHQIELSTAQAEEEFSLVDVVDLTNLRANKSYQLRASMVDANGQAISEIAPVTHQVTADEIAKGKAKVNFTVKGSVLLKYQSVVAFEELYVNGEAQPVAEHKNPGDKGQTVTVKRVPRPLKPQLVTKAAVYSVGGQQIAEESVITPGEQVKVRDQINYSDLAPETAYTVVSKLYKLDKTGNITGDPVDTQLTQVTTGKAGSADQDAVAGQFVIDFAGGFKAEPNTVYVVFERVYKGSFNSVDSVDAEAFVKGHEVANDAKQQISVTAEKPVPAQFKINKQVAGKGRPAGDLTFNFSVECTSGSHPVTITVPAGKASSEATITGLTSGETCVVSEDNASAASYTLQKAFSSSSTGVTVNKDKTMATVRLDKSNAQSVQLNVRNTYTPNKGKFQVKKLVTKADRVVGAPTSFGFEYRCGSGDWTSLGNLSNNQASAEIEQPVGTECLIRERAVASSTASNTLSWYGNGVTNVGDGTAKIVVGNSGTVVATATNALTPKTGQLKLTKKVVNGTAGQLPLPGTFSFDYYCVAEGQLVKNGKVTVGANASTVIDQLPAGAICYLDENKAAAEVNRTNLEVTYAQANAAAVAAKQVVVNGQTLHNAGGAYAVEAGQTVEVQATNNYTDVTGGSFQVSKALAGTGREKAADKSFKFEYTCKIPGTQNATTSHSFMLKAGETYSSTQDATSFPLGTTCELKEVQAADAEGAKFQQVSWFKNSIDNNPANLPQAGKVGQAVSFVLNDSQATAKFTATNFYANKLGGLTIRKAVTGKVPAGLAKYSFSLDCGKAYPQRDFTIGTYGGSHSFWGIPVGTRCTITETGAQAADGSPLSLSDARTSHQLVWQGTENDGSHAASNTVVISKEQTREEFDANQKANLEVVATNKFTPKQQHGKFSITKASAQVVGTEAKHFQIPASFQFSYDCGSAGSGNLQVAKGETKTVTGLPSGASCTIRETAQLPQGTNGQNVAWRVDGVGSGVGAASETPVTITIGDNTTVAVVADNQYTVPDNPSIQTQLDPAQGVKLDPNADGATYVLTDRIKYSNLIVGQSYQFTGRLMYVDAQGKSHETSIAPQTETMVAQQSNGFHEVSFQVTAEQLKQYSKLVAFERLGLIVDGKVKPVAEHENPNDPNQSENSNPWIRTVLEAKDGAKEISTEGLKDSDVVEMVDTVEYHNLLAGKEYHLFGALSDGTTKAHSSLVGVNAYGETFTPQGDPGTLVSGKATVVFKVPVSVIRANAKLVAFEYLYQGPKPPTPPTPPNSDIPTPPVPSVPPVAEHEDPNDPNQSVKEKPSIGTTATGKNGEKQLLAGQAVTIKDVVEWRKLQPGSYLAVGQLMDKATGQPVPGVTTTPTRLEVAAGSLSGTVQVNFQVPADQVTANSQFVVFEEIYRATDVTENQVNPGATAVVRHQNINDAAQTVRVVAPEKPVIGTIASNAEGKITDRDQHSSDKFLLIGKDSQVKDSVMWSKLPAGEYVLFGSLVKVAPNAVPGDLPQGAVDWAQTASFQVAEGQLQGVVESYLNVPGSTITAGSKYVVFERVFKKSDVDAAKGKMPDTSKLVGNHEDITDGAQTLYPVAPPPAAPPALKLEKQVQSDSAAASAHEFVFTLSCEGVESNFDPIKVKAGQSAVSLPNTLQVGQVCTLAEDLEKAKLDGKAPTEISFSTRSNVEGTMEIASQAGSGVATFTVPDLNQNGAVITISARNVYAPEPPVLKTQAKNTADSSQILPLGKDAKVRDTVSYQNLNPQQSYVVVGKLVKKSDPNAYIAKACSAQPFKPSAKNGSTEVDFEVPAAKLQAGESYVAFEDLYPADKVNIGEGCKVSEGETPIASHRDPQDPAQTVTVPKPTTPPGNPPNENTPPPVPHVPAVPPVNLAVTGSTAITLVAGALLLAVAGFGLVLTRRFQREESAE